MGKPHVVVLIHGIRDFALWQVSIRETLKNAAFIVEHVNYGRFNLIEFLTPIPYFRKKAIDRVEHQLRIVRDKHKDADISLIAHSFGTYVAAHVMSSAFDWRFHRVILCGSVLWRHYPFEHIKDRFTDPILNDVGSRDIWPAFAESITFGYGSIGTYGFFGPYVYDRWHNGAYHGYFLTSEFCETFWVPFLRDGREVAAASVPEEPRWWLKLISVFKIRYVLFAVIAGFIAWWAGTLVPPTLVLSPTPSRPEVLGDADWGLFCAQNITSSPVAFFDYVTVTLTECTPANAGGSRSFRVPPPLQGSATLVPAERPGYSHCFLSDFNVRAPAIQTAMADFIAKSKERISCKINSYTTRLITLSYVTPQNDSKTVAFTQTYNVGDDRQFAIGQIPSTNVVRSDALQSVPLRPNGQFEVSDLLTQIRQFNFPGIIKD
jgi:pimeloyl-ACP methyl ester carboxylesterase